jgi:hypothetical protein
LTRSRADAASRIAEKRTLASADAISLTTDVGGCALRVADRMIVKVCFWDVWSDGHLRYIASVPADRSVTNQRRW